MCNLSLSLHVCNNVHSFMGLGPEENQKCYSSKFVMHLMSFYVLMTGGPCPAAIYFRMLIKRFQSELRLLRQVCAHVRVRVFVCVWAA